MAFVNAAEAYTAFMLRKANIASHARVMAESRRKAELTSLHARKYPTDFVNSQIQRARPFPVGKRAHLEWRKLSYNSMVGRKLAEPTMQLDLFTNYA